MIFPLFRKPVLLVRSCWGERQNSTLPLPQSPLPCQTYIYIGHTRPPHKRKLPTDFYTGRTKEREKKRGKTERTAQKKTPPIHAYVLYILEVRFLVRIIFLFLGFCDLHLLGRRGRRRIVVRIIRALGPPVRTSVSRSSRCSNGRRDSTAINNVFKILIVLLVVVVFFFLVLGLFLFFFRLLCSKSSIVLRDSYSSLAHGPTGHQQKGEHYHPPAPH